MSRWEPEDWAKLIVASGIPLLVILGIVLALMG